jgi:hypothetical protein
MKTIKLKAMRFGSKTFWFDTNIFTNMKIDNQILATISKLSKPQIKLAYLISGTGLRLIDYENYANHNTNEL